MNTEGGKIKTRAESGKGVALDLLAETSCSFSFTSNCLPFFSCQLGKTKVELNEANEEAPHLALLL